MQIRYFYETDCFHLNKKAELYYPLPYRMADLLRKVIRRKTNPSVMSPSYSPDINQKLIQKINEINSRIDWKQDLRKASYVVFDTETTGLQPLKGDKITSIAGVIIENGEIKYDQYFDKLVDPQKPIPPTASYITGITNEMVKGKEKLEQVLLQFLNFTEERILIAHNAVFDITFLNIGLSQIAPVRIVNPVIDTYILSRYLLPDLIEYSLENLASNFSIEVKERHTALGDSITTAKLFQNLLNILLEKNITTLESLSDFLLYKRKMEQPFGTYEEMPHS